MQRGSQCFQDAFGAGLTNTHRAPNKESIFASRQTNSGRFFCRVSAAAIKAFEWLCSQRKKNHRGDKCTRDERRGGLILYFTITVDLLTD